MTREEYRTLKRRADEKRERKKREQDMTAMLKKYRQALAREHNPERRKSLYAQQREYYITHTEQPRVIRQLDPMNYKRIYTNGGGIWACFECNATRENGVQLDIHHKDQNHSNNEFSNLVCLCSKCHKDLHERWRNQTIPYLIKYHMNWRGHIHGRSEPL